MAALGAVLAVALKQQIHERAAADARDLAQRIADGVIDEHLRQKHFEHGLDGRTLADIDLSIETLLLRGTIENAKIYEEAGGSSTPSSATSSARTSTTRARRRVRGVRAAGRRSAASTRRGRSSSTTVMDTIARLHGFGVRLSVDDFGTGYSSLPRLLELGCDAAQGYHLLRPQPAAQITAWPGERQGHRARHAPADIVIGDGTDPRSS